jgi:hypothetical protein
LSPRLRQAAWFVGLWAAGVASLLAASLVIRLLLRGFGLAK